MYSETINKIISAINSGRSDLCQMLLSTLLVSEGGEINQDAKRELLDAIPESKIIYGKVPGIGLRAGYLLVNGERYYFA